ncbi:hypothetical protein WDJ51_07195 [Rathayibacter sp. YIM 133350]|uniref:hypothetical protein n=1 Tax=Rathayibacter sp. YIM 133350 TaxID=3131992 RepID=UPI00307DF4DA
MATPEAQNSVYVAEFIDGPLEGEVESRVLIDGAYEKRLAMFAAIEGLESTFWYDAIDEREVNDEVHVRYRFDAGDSDSPVSSEEPGER